MHQRTWLSIFTLPIVTAFTYPVAFKSAQDSPRVEVWNANRNSIVGISDIQDVLTLIHSNYVDKPDIEKVISGGIQSVLERAHPMNSYLTVEDLGLSNPGYAGVGITVIKRKIYALVTSVIPGSPADRLGIKVGYKIRQLNNHSVGTMSAWTLERTLCGRPGADLTVVYYVTNPIEPEKVTLKFEMINATPINISSSPRANIVTLTDLNRGRTSELKAILEGLNYNVPLVLDIRQCAGGSLSEAASAAGMFVSTGPLAIVKEAGKPPVSLSVIPASTRQFANVAVLQGRYTIGAAEALSSALKLQHIPVFGDRTYGLGVERTRFLLRNGAAVEIVNKHWIGAGGELLGSGGERLDEKFVDTLKDDPGDAVSSPIHCGVLPNYAIQVDRSECDWLHMVLKVIETKGKS